ncbi:chemotaxis protein CheC [Candidatus Bathyarchaeota archaeon]|nr:chemotaxis protein CheC [Candidatus Bathyarchaeota archaeon]
MNKKSLTSKTVNSTENFTDLDILLEIGSMGAGHATTTLSQVLHEPIKIEVPRVHIAPPHLVPRIYEKHDTIVTAVFLKLRGTADCDLMLIFEEEESKKIAELMINGVEDGGVTREMELSAIEEMGSIVLCSFLNAMADFTLTKLVSPPPELIIDSFDAIIDDLLIKQALCSEVAVIFDTRFKRCNSSTEGFIITFPSYKLQRMLATKGKEWLDNESSVKKDALPALLR